MRIEIGQIFAQIISFLIMLWVLKRYAWKPLLGLLEERKNKIASEFETIEQQKLENAHIKNEYQRKLKEIEELARFKMQRAIEDGQQLALKIQKDAQVQAKKIITTAEEEVQKEIRRAKIQLKNELVKISLMATEKILNMSLDGEKQKELVMNFVEQSLTQK